MESLYDVTALSHLVLSPSYIDVATLIIMAIVLLAVLTNGHVWNKPDPYNHLFYEVPQEKDAARRQARKQTRNVAQQLEETSTQLAIFWGSQSGTGETFANNLARECHQRFGIKTMSLDLSDYDAETISKIPETRLAIFILSTYGEGDPSDNTHGFWDWINRAAGISVPNLRYMAFGLGNTNYKYYNRVVNLVAETLDKSGATRLMPVGLADDAKGTTKEDFLCWKTLVFAYLRDSLGYEEKESRYEPTMSVVEDDSLQVIDLHHGEPLEPRSTSTITTANSPVKALSVRHSTELFTSSTRNCLHMELDLNDQPEINYKTGDHLAVWPMNPDDEVERLLSVLGLEMRRDVPISIKSLDPSVKIHVPTPTSVGALFRYYLEICAPISRDTLQSLAAFAPTNESKTILLGIAKDKETFAEYASQHITNLGRILEATDCTKGVWSTLPLSWVLETFPYVKPRYYSISSSSVVAPRSPSITAVVSTQQLNEASTERIFGLTTNYLLALKQSLHKESPQPHPHGLTYTLAGPNNILAPGKIHAHIRKSTLRLPTLSSHPIIMVAAGTGVAPFRAFVTERARLKAMGRRIGRTILFFGCRKADEDYIYKDELQGCQDAINDGAEPDAGPTMSIVTAFSRADVHSKHYVQHRVAEQAAEVCSLLLEHNANMYICGSAAMARDVAETVCQALRSSKGWSEEEWKEWSGKQKRARKWQEDVWG